MKLPSPNRSKIFSLSLQLNCTPNTTRLTETVWIFWHRSPGLSINSRNPRCPWRTPNNSTASWRRAMTRSKCPGCNSTPTDRPWTALEKIYPSARQTQQSVQQTTFPCSHPANYTDKTHLSLAGCNQRQSFLDQLYPPRRKHPQQLHRFSLVPLISGIHPCLAEIGLWILELLVKVVSLHHRNCLLLISIFNIMRVIPML